MDIPNYRCFQPPSAFLASNGESTMEPDLKLHGKGKDKPFVDAFSDPLCNLNLRETSEIVRSFPASNCKDKTEESRGFLENVSSQRRREGSNSVTQRKLHETPSTPGRSSFSFTNVNNLSRKTIPSKWDDAEKWLMSSSCHSSPAHHNVKILSQTSKVRKQFDNFKEQLEGFSEKSRNKEERVLKAVSSFHGSASLDHHNAVRALNGISRSTDMSLKDEFTDDIESTFCHFKYTVPTKEGFLFRNQGSEAMKDAWTKGVHHRDAMTETTSLGSSTTSRCHTPFKSSSPARHNTPASRSGPLALANQNSTGCTLDIIQLEQCHFDKLKLGTKYDSVTSNWSSREEEEEDISKSLRHNDDANQKNDIGCTAAQWEEDEKTRCCLRYQREEAKIQAWVNLQIAKAEAQSRKLEVKIEKMRSNLEEKLMKRMAVVHRKAEEWRAAARLQHHEQIQKATEQAQKMMINSYNPTISDHSLCGCFPCNNNLHQTYKCTN